VARHCQACGQELGDLARFCSNCGAPQVDAGPDTEVESTGKLEVLASSTGPLSPVSTGSLGAVAPGTAMLIVRRGPSEGTSFLLDSDRVAVGRSDDSDVVLDDVTVSRQHAQFVREGAGWQLHDLESLNGTYVNRDRIDGPVELSGGDEVQIGKYRFVFLVGGDQS
jgi:pSer/pThr/pTyr-binding forkhead associated (FHA) protein